MKNNRFNQLLAILFCTTITISSFCKVKKHTRPTQKEIVLKKALNNRMELIKYKNNTAELFDTIKQEIIHTFHNVRWIARVNDNTVRIQYQNDTAELFDSIKTKTIHTFHNVFFIWNPYIIDVIGIQYRNGTSELFDFKNKRHKEYYYYSQSYSV
ncbi:MAG: hypothetical protein WCD44_03460 [Candidatus Babeliales bacterium]